MNAIGILGERAAAPLGWYRIRPERRACSDYKSDYGGMSEGQQVLTAKIALLDKTRPIA
jgi:hypothetical protein